MAAEVFNKRAELYQDKYMDVSAYAGTLDTFCAQLPMNAQVLEIACGPGNITRYLLSKRPDLRILGTDLAPNMIVLAKANNPEAEFELMDCKDIASLRTKYDAIVCGFVLPYLSKEEAVQLISDVAQVIITNGVLYLSTMEGDYGSSGIETSSAGDEVYLFYHESDYLSEALRVQGFNIIEQNLRKYPGDTPKPITDLVIVAKKAIAAVLVIRLHQCQKLSLEG